MDIFIVTKGLQQGRVPGIMGQDPEIDLGIISGQEDQPITRDKGLTDTTSILAATGDVLEVGVARRQAASSGDGLVERGMNPARNRINQARQFLDIGREEFGHIAIGDDPGRQFMFGGQFFQDGGISGIASLDLFAMGEAKLIKENDSQLLGRLDIELMASQKIDLLFQDLEPGLELLGQLGQGSEAEEQVAFADVILLNKTDLVSPEELEKVEGKITAINPYARIHKTQKSQIELAAILDKGAFDLNRILEFEPDFLEHGHDHNHEEEVKSLSITSDRSVDPEKFQKWMGALLQLRGADIFRSKGILAIDGAPRRYVYQGVHMMMDSDWGSPWNANDKRASKLVFIGRNLDGDNLKRGFEDCLK